MAEIPRGMRTLERDGRGYPIPFIVMRDKRGLPHFPINNTSKVAMCLRRKLCGICGKRIVGNAWLVGGPNSFLHENGAFVDPPVHHDCGHFAMQTCPYLAAPRYARRIDDRKLGDGALPDGFTIAKDLSMIDERPDVFGFGEVSGFDVIHPQPGIDYIIPHRFLFLEWWRHGKRCAAPSLSTPVNGVLTS